MSDMLDVSNVTDATTEITKAVADIEEITEPINTEDSAEPTLTIDELNQTIESLKAELESYKSAKAQQEAIAAQINEFSELFPEISVRSIPESVWDDVRRGNSLAAAYSIYERRITEAARRIEQINAQNAEKSAGVAGKNLTPEFFSADDVRKMSPSEVRANFAKIRRSMEKWN